mgnify:CR=1 FL=1
MKKHIPNTITCLNLVCGCISIMTSLRGNLDSAALWIIMAAIFDFLDGMSARILKVSTAIGKELDSLADIVSFGVAPSMIIFVWLSRCFYEMPSIYHESVLRWLPYTLFLIPALSAVRLARFNMDERQHTNFIGLPTPANALFLAFIPYAAEKVPFLNNFWIVWIFSIGFALLLVSNINMISLKFTSFEFKGENIVRYVILTLGIVLFLIFRWSSFPIIILCYLLICIIYHAIIKFYNI